MSRSIERLEPDYQGATYTTPLDWGHTLGYMSNAWCWHCGTYTKHGYNDDRELGISKRWCYNCGGHYAIALCIVTPLLATIHKQLIDDAHRKLQEM